MNKLTENTIKAALRKAGYEYRLGDYSKKIGKFTVRMWLHIENQRTHNRYVQCSDSTHSTMSKFYIKYFDEQAFVDWIGLMERSAEFAQHKEENK